MRRQRCDDEVEAVVAERPRGVERAPQAVEDGVARGAEPRLLVEVVDGDEAARAGVVADEPVVAARAERDVLQCLDVETPAVDERARQRLEI
ncbi:MAG TPA: hypothetical protein VIG35_08875 [Gaiellaceae bacterium]